MNFCLKCNFLSIPGLSEYLGTEICTSRQKRFSLVTFVDSPGLVDGDMKYPFDVDQAILWLGVCWSLGVDIVLIYFLLHVYMFSILNVCL